MLACVSFVLYFQNNMKSLSDFLRLFFGLLSVIVFCLLSLKTLKSKAAVLFANMLFVLNYQLIYFSQELKHYACDVFCFCVILLFVFYVDKIKDNFKLLVATGMVFALSVWFSYTASFALFAVFLILQKLSKKQLLRCLYCLVFH